MRKYSKTLFVLCISIAVASCSLFDSESQGPIQNGTYENKIDTIITGNQRERVINFKFEYSSFIKTLDYRFYTESGMNKHLFERQIVISKGRYQIRNKRLVYSHVYEKNCFFFIDSIKNESDMLRPNDCEKSFTEAGDLYVRQDSVEIKDDSLKVMVYNPIWDYGEFSNSSMGSFDKVE